MSLDDKSRELIAIGAAIAANSAPSLKYHVTRAKELGVEDPEIREAAEVGRFVRRGAASKTDIFLESLGTPPPRGRCRQGGTGRGDGCGCDGPSRNSAEPGGPE